MEWGGGEMEAVIQHFSHEHRLKLCMEKEDRVVRVCKGCGLPIFFEGYGCADCLFFIHISCAELPRDVVHPFHPQHRLNLHAEPPCGHPGRSECDACGKICDGFTYHCSECGFDMDINCVTLKPTAKSYPGGEEYPNQCFTHPHPLILCDNKKEHDFPCSQPGCRQQCNEALVYVCLECRRFLHKSCAELGMTIQHFSHEHCLKLCTEDRVVGVCKGCGLRLPISGESYGCANCLFFMHKSCAELPRKVVHPFHPQHHLNLHVEPPYGHRGRSGCDACGKICDGFTYHCSECGFDMDVNCVTLKPTAKSYPGDEEYPNQHFTHPHPLILCNNEKNHDFCCSQPGCRRRCNDSFVYICLECRCFLHKSCAELGMTIQHPLHPQHLLTLLPDLPSRGRSFFCNACGLGCGRRTTFNCSECTFYLHGHCASSLIPTKNDEGREHKIRHFTHPHPLIQCAKQVNFPFTCYVCEQPFDEDAVNVCLECNLLLHKSCADLPKVIKHPLHPAHQLTLRSPSNSQTDDTSLTSGLINHCRVCVSPTTRWRYGCANCIFRIDAKCISVSYIRDTRFHQHALVYFKKVPHYHYGLHCNSCCNTESRQTPFIHCAEYSCYFDFHVSCVPTLPPTLKDKHHRHPLTLTNSIIKDNPDEDENAKGAEFYCDSCEERRNIADRSYYCADAESDCHYVAHVGCVVTQVLNLLEKKYMNPRLVSKTLMVAGSEEEEKLKINDAEANESETSSVGTGIILVGVPRGSDQTTREFPSVMKLDEEIKVLHAELEEQTTKLEAARNDLKVERTVVDSLRTKLEALKERRVPNVAS